MDAAHWDGVRRVYLEGIATGHATFETDAPSWEIWDGAHRQDARLVARRAGCVIGWAALTRVSGRCVYAGVAEVSVYVAESARGEGVGRALLEALIAASEAAGVWTLQAGIFPENAASIALHERCGFRVVGVYRRHGKLEGQWQDCVIVERLLE